MITSQLMPARVTHADTEPLRRYLTGPQVCERYSITDMTLWRWLRAPRTPTAFPLPAMRFNKRRYWLESDLITWERRRRLPEA